MINKLSTRIVVYTTSLVLITLVIFTVGSMVTIMALRRYSIDKVEKVFRKNADENLEKEVMSYANILKGYMDSRKSISYIFGKIIEKDLLQSGNLKKGFLKGIFREMSNMLNMREIAIFNYAGKTLSCFPSYKSKSVLRSYIMKLTESTLNKKIFYFDFHINTDKTVSFSFIYLGRDKQKRPVFVVFDYNPYGFYSLVKSAQFYPYSQKYLWVVNRKGYLIYEPPTKKHKLITLLDRVDISDKKNGAEISEILRNEILKGKAGVARYVFRGVDEFVGYTYVKGFGWGLGLSMPTDIFFKPINGLSVDIKRKTVSTLALFGLFSSLIILFTVLATFFVSKNIVNPINQTIEAVESILKGDYSKRLHESGIEELDRLAGAINRLVDYFNKTVETLSEDRYV